MDHVPFYKTRMGEKFICKTVPDLVKAIERLASGIEGERAPAVQQLIESAGQLCDNAEKVLNVEIVAGRPRSREAFDSLRRDVKTVRELLALNTGAM